MPLHNPSVKRTTICNTLTIGIFCHNWCAHREKLIEDVEQHYLTWKGAFKEKKIHENYHYPWTKVSFSVNIYDNAEGEKLHSTKKKDKII